MLVRGATFYMVFTNYTESIGAAHIKYQCIFVFLNTSLLYCPSDCTAHHCDKHLIRSKE